MKIILVNPNLVHTSLVNILLILIMVRTLDNNYFLVRTKLGYFRYCLFELPSFGFTTVDYIFGLLILEAMLRKTQVLSPTQHNI